MIRNTPSAQMKTKLRESQSIIGNIHRSLSIPRSYSICSIHRRAPAIAAPDAAAAAGTEIARSGCVDPAMGAAAVAAAVGRLGDIVAGMVEDKIGMAEGMAARSGMVRQGQWDKSQFGAYPHRPPIWASSYSRKGSR